MKKWESASRPETVDQMQYHIGLRPGDIAPTVLLPGDPDRATLISKLWDSSKNMARKRSYVTYTGIYKNTRISTTSTGIGCPATAIAIEELATIGAKTFIRVGSSGAIQKDIQCGDLIISTGVIVGMDVDVRDDDGEGRKSLMIWSGVNNEFWLTMDKYPKVIFK